MPRKTDGKDDVSYGLIYISWTGSPGRLQFPYPRPGSYRQELVHDVSEEEVAVGREVLVIESLELADCEDVIEPDSLELVLCKEVEFG